MGRRRCGPLGQVYSLWYKVVSDECAMIYSSRTGGADLLMGDSGETTESLRNAGIGARASVGGAGADLLHAGQGFGDLPAGDFERK